MENELHGIRNALEEAANLPDKWVAEESERFCWIKDLATKIADPETLGSGDRRLH